MADFKALGNEALQKKDFAKAEQYYTQGIAQDANNHVLFSNRASARLALSQFEGALDDSVKSVEINPKWSKGWFRKGQALYGLGRLEEAVEAIQKAIEIEPSDQFKKVLAEVEAVLQNQERQQAQNIFSDIAKQFASPQIWTIIASNPELKPHLNDQTFVNNINLIAKNPAMLQPLMQSDQRLMQLLLVLLGAQRNPNAQPQAQAEPEEPKPEPKKAEEPAKPKAAPAPAPEPVQDDDEATKQKNLGNEFYSKKQFDKALEHYNKAISLDETNGVFKLNRAAVYLETGKYDECIKDCEDSVELARKKHDFKLKAKAYARIASCYAKQEKYEDAIKWYEESITEHRTDETSKKLHQTKQLKEKKDELAYINPEIAEQEKQAGNEAFKKNDYPAAVQRYKEAVKRDPKNPIMYSNLGSAYMKLAEYMYALRNFEKTVELDPKFVKGWARKAQCHFFMKEYHKALDAYDEGLKIEPSNQELMEGKTKVQMAIYTSGHDEQRVKQAMQDPEIQAILQDPIMQQVLNDLKDPKLQQKHMANPTIAAKIKKLIAAGVIQTR